MKKTTDVKAVFLYGLTIFLSAFLLFQVQPMMGKMILPWFGGSASVWTTCMLFFQALLLLGYLYTHWVVNHLTPLRQSLLHMALLASCVLLLPIMPSEIWKPTGGENPTLRILGLLTASIGLPYLVLSTTGPLVQAWFARERSGTVTYRLFALSNFGSMLALLAYPFVVEPLLPTRWQSLAWSGLFILFVLACGSLAWRGRHAQPIAQTPEVSDDLEAKHHKASSRPRPGQLLLWVALAACPSILMVANTSYLTQNIAPIPLLWIAPLALYLLTFIVCFERQGWYQRRIFLPLLVLSLGALAYLPTLGLSDLPLMLAMGINLSAFFGVCMVCHGELALQQPPTKQLTLYYLMLSVGGFLGGFFVGVIAPYAFDGHYELSVAVILSGLVVSLSLWHAWPSISHGFNRRIFAVGSALSLAVLTTVCVNDHVQEASGVEMKGRNFYGSLRVFAFPEEGYRSMLHGQIVHGKQFLAPERAMEPTTYYNAQAGAGLAITTQMTKGPVRVGVIGLGVGTLAAYGRLGDSYRMYEIDPLVIGMAKKNFSFLSKTLATTELVLGDARLQLEAEAPQQFDVLVVDAFSGDSVPVHLLTREAFEQYARHLKPNGVLAVHITNRFLDLQPVMQTAAQKLGFTVRLVEHPGDSDNLVYPSSWALLAKDPQWFEQVALKSAQKLESQAGFVPWTDDYSSLFAVVK
jgi:spermidine synthase